MHESRLAPLLGAVHGERPKCPTGHSVWGSKLHSFQSHFIQGDGKWYDTQNGG